MARHYERDCNDIAEMHRRILFVEGKAKLYAMLETFHDEMEEYENIEERLNKFFKELELEIY